MGTVTALALYQQAAEILVDRTYVTYLESQLLAWVNDAQRAVVLVRPDAKASRESVSLTPEVSRQTLPAGALRLGGLIRNMGEDGNTIGRAITGPVPREPLDAVSPNWAVTPGAYVQQYVYEEDAPQYFDVYPPVTGTWYVEAKLYRVPADVSVSSGAIDLDDIYAPALREWLLYNTFARDSERTPNYVRAGRHFVNFFQLLGIKTRADLAVSPKVVEHSKQLEVAR